MYTVIYTDINDLHKFVTVALHTAAGEGDLANSRLSQLKIVGSAYAPLIYDLKNSPTFESFQQCCIKVWKVHEQSSSETASPAMILVGYNVICTISTCYTFLQVDHVTRLYS